MRITRKTKLYYIIYNSRITLHIMHKMNASDKKYVKYLT